MTDDASARTAEADDLRLRGNHEFSGGRYDAALSLYTAALEQLVGPSMEGSNSSHDSQQRAVLLCNRSATYFQQEEYELAEQDALQAWELSNHTSVKAAFRLARTQLALQQFQGAKETIQAALKLIDQEDQLPLVTEKNVDDTAETAAEVEAVDSKGGGSSAQQRKALEDLWSQVLTAALKHEELKTTKPETSIRYAKRPISIKEFTKHEALGYGNFSEIVVVKHKVTGEQFALKMISKKQAADLAKRQHPNVYNEIQMERRVLLERMTKPHPYIVRMYHAFQDYNTLYYLMDLHTSWSDLWSELQWEVDAVLPSGDTSTAASTTQQRKQKHMIGCNRSQAVRWIFQMVDALEHMHKYGIVHRDLKTENIMLSARGHVVVLDFGTAKDLIETDLNGPEFVGTPDFMSPEAVSGTSGMEEAKQEAAKGVVRVVHTADIYALGAMLYIMQTGMTPFWSNSQYLAFLKIKRGNLTRPVGIVDDEAWDLIQKLMQKDPTKRLGADAFELVIDKKTGKRTMEQKIPSGYDMIRQHPFFAACHGIEKQVREETPIPSLQDLCVRPVATRAYQESLDVELCDRHPPGDGSKHDMMRLSPRDRAAVMHVLERLQLLREPRLYARFFVDSFACRLDKVRPATRDFMGLTQMNDGQGKAPHAVMHDPYAKPIAMDDIEIVHLTNPLFSQEKNVSCDDATRKKWIKLLKKCVAGINRSRPKLVMACGYIDEKCRKLLARISDSIPVVAHDGSAFFTVWIMGVQCLAIQSNKNKAKAEEDDGVLSEESAQMAWLREHMEQGRLSKHPLFCFTDCDPRDLPATVTKRMARGRVLCLFGLASQNETSFSSVVSYKANEMVPCGTSGKDNSVSIRSVDSEDEEKDNFSMKVEGTIENGLRCITIGQEPGDWMARFKPIELVEE